MEIRLCGENDHVKFLELSGRLDATTSVEADRYFTGLLENNSDNLALDFKKLEYISSAGLRVMLLIAKKLQPKGQKIALCNLSPNVREVFDISGFSTIFKIYSDPDAALNYLKS